MPSYRCTPPLANTSRHVPTSELILTTVTPNYSAPRELPKFHLSVIGCVPMSRSPPVRNWFVTQPLSIFT